MKTSSRAVRSIACLLLIAQAPIQPLLAQQVATEVGAKADAVPWLYRGSDIPPDPGWRFGELGNGIKYAARRNGVPPGQVSIRIRVDSGSLYEKDSGRGGSAETLGGKRGG